MNICIFKVTFNWNQIWIRFQVHFWTLPGWKFQQRNSEILNFYLSFQGMSRTDLRKTHSNRFMKNSSGSIFQARSWWNTQEWFFQKSVSMTIRKLNEFYRKLKFRRNIWIINAQKPLLARFRDISRSLGKFILTNFQSKVLMKFTESNIDFGDKWMLVTLCWWQFSVIVEQISILVNHQWWYLLNVGARR